MRKSGFSEEQIIKAGGSSPEPVAALTPSVLSGNLGFP